nr:MAG TPA: hypothetical protein [Caudoviricetes sp.]
MTGQPSHHHRRNGSQHLDGHNRTEQRDDAGKSPLDAFPRLRAWRQRLLGAAELPLERPQRQPRFDAAAMLIIFCNHHAPYLSSKYLRLILPRMNKNPFFSSSRLSSAMIWYAFDREQLKSFMMSTTYRNVGSVRFFIVATLLFHTVPDPAGDVTEHALRLVAHELGLADDGFCHHGDDRTRRCVRVNDEVLRVALAVLDWSRRNEILVILLACQRLENVSRLMDSLLGIFICHLDHLNT